MHAEKYITISSEQAWPQIIALRKFQPKEAYLLHTNDELRSHSPCLRLRDFIENNQPATKVTIISIGEGRIPEDVANIIDSNTTVNVTGGTKLMAINLLRESITRQAKVIYCDHNSIHSLDSGQNQRGFTQEPLDKSMLIDDIDPLELVKSQYSGNFSNSGILLELSSYGKTLTKKKLASLDSSNLMKAFKARDPLPDVSNDKGKRAEFLNAGMFLLMGVQKYRIGICVSATDKNIIQEIDGLFTYNAHLYLIETKQRKKKANPIAIIRRHLDRLNLSYQQREPIKKALGQLKGMETSKKGSAYFEDRYFGNALGGTNANVIWVTQSATDQDHAFAESTGIRLITQQQLISENFDLTSLR